MIEKALSPIQEERDEEEEAWPSLHGNREREVRGQ